ncbi:MAG: Kae1-associated serine/threonine protein kinase [Nitrosarchaeum sp.]|nr:Kae1-associated serine/threonine protein kinase [Nitrosarchaeum sp.]
MTYLPGPKLADCLEQHPELAKHIGRLVAALHDQSIIHGDLTTSNMILSDGAVHLIDFGLSFFSHRIEDKAVDIHLLRQALESKHHTIWESAFEAVLSGYHPNEREQILQRYTQVESRGKNKSK